VTLSPDVRPSTESPGVRLIVVGPECDRLRRLLDRLSGTEIRIAGEFSDPDGGGEALASDGADLVLARIAGNPVRGIEMLADRLVSATRLPVIVIADIADAGAERRAMQLGAQDYLVIERLEPPTLERSIRWSLARSREIRDLRQDSDFFRTLLDHVPDRIYFKDRESRFVRVSRAVAEAHGFHDPMALIGETDSAIYPPGQAEETLRDERRVMETRTPIVGKVARRTLPDGSEVWLSSTKLPLEDRNGRVVGTFGITRDVTPLKRLEMALDEERTRLAEANLNLTDALGNLQRAHAELSSVQLQLIEAEKLKSIGRLAAGVAHEVKNPLAILSMGIEFLRTRHAGDEMTLNVLKEFADAVGRADSVIKGMLDFSAPRKIELQPCDLATIIRTALRLVRGEIRKAGHQIELDAEGLPAVLADRVKTCQVFVNLITNALHAMPEGGVLTVRAQTEQASIDHVSTGFRPGEEIVVVEISDTGCGIPPEVLDRIFEPFVTTKTAGKGTGLGMSIVRSIMNLQRGAVSIRNGQSGGAVATVTFRTTQQP
jgi:PAS domain S-box